MSRKLASIQEVLAIHPIANADAIELVQINGWQCVVKKGEFKVGDLGLYLEIDAVPPIEGPNSEPFAFLWKDKLQPASNFRIKTMKLRGTLSQGLFLPLNLIPALSDINPEIGLDVTELLGVSKYEPSVGPAGRGQQCGNFPYNVPKTDEDRIQSNLVYLKKLQGLPYVITLKCDGSSATYTAHDGKILACSRNYIIMEGDNVYWRLVSKYDMSVFLLAHPHLALQGEVVGPGIQKNRLGLKDIELRAFNLFDKISQRYLSQKELESYCSAYKIPTAPVLEEGGDFQHSLQSLLQLAEGLYEGTKNEREGIVIRSRDLDEYGNRISFKAISNKFLLKGGD